MNAWRAVRSLEAPESRKLTTPLEGVGGGWWLKPCWCLGASKAGMENEHRGELSRVSQPPPPPHPPLVPEERGSVIKTQQTRRTRGLGAGCRSIQVVQAAPALQLNGSEVLSTPANAENRWHDCAL